jgi:hypothetical protein
VAIFFAFCQEDTRMPCLHKDETPVPVISPVEEGIIALLAGRDHYPTRIKGHMSRMVKRGLLARRTGVEEPKERDGKRRRYTYYVVTDLGLRALEEAVTIYREEGRRPQRRALQPNIPPELIWRLFRIAKSRGKPMTHVLNEIIEENVERLEREGPLLSLSELWPGAEALVTQIISTPAPAVTQPS